MLELKKIEKIYEINDFKQTALNGVSLKFRENEFVSILGPSGSGKTTMLNIIGGLDTYSSGDLLINGVSTKKYKDVDWDTYRNHHVGFVFQSYNLITHQTVLANVELALTISGVDVKERRKRAAEVLEKVGLKNHLNKKPNQLSGGQMQRVAIARALINNPDILLADEPTGALDTETSKQIMDLLKEIAAEKLVIMVTHNPELAEEYSTRIVKVLDGDILSDSLPFDGKEKHKEQNIKGKKFMSFKTALNLSFNNLLTKKGRTFMTSFAGSIGIIGIATILSLSNGVQEYINRVEEDTLTGYPLTISEYTVDASSIITGMGNVSVVENPEKDTVYSNDMMVDMLSTFTSQMSANNLKEFKKYIEDESNGFLDELNAISYGYNLDLQLYKNSDTEVIKVNPNELFEELMSYNPLMSAENVWIEMIDNRELFENQYDLLAGDYPSEYNEVLVVLDGNYQLSDFALYTLGLKDQSDIEDIMNSILSAEPVEQPEQTTYTYDDLLDLSFKAVLNSDYYVKENNIWIDNSTSEEFMLNLLSESLEIEVVGIVQTNPESNISGVPTGGIFYTSDLTEYVIKEINNSQVAIDQLASTDINVLTGLEFTEETSFDINSLTPEEQAYMSTLSQAELAELMNLYSSNAAETYESVLAKIGVVDLDNPSAINLYPKDFKAKDNIEGLIEKYNTEQEELGLDDNVITYTDIVGMMMSSVTTIINMITYVLITFVSISLIVSSIMIGIITYISVLERTKEIGILRAIGASKKDISRVFNAETFIVGLCAGSLGIFVTIIINSVANVVIKSITDISNLSVLPLNGAIFLIFISVFLTLVAGLIPSKIASKKNPVESLRSE
ncbi:MAG: ABC transporter ATP-binding protein/permease [bacterium]